MSEAQSASSSVSLADLTAFRRDVLRALAHEGPSKGLSVKDALEEYYGERVNHGRLYPNLDALVNKGLVSKSERDARTNEYALTHEGEQALEARDDWTSGDGE